MKILFKGGNSRLMDYDVLKIQELTGIKTVKTIKAQLKALIDLDWVYFKAYPGEYVIRSTRNIGIKLNLTSKQSVQLNCEHFKFFNAFLGASIFASCHFMFWRNKIKNHHLKREFKIGDKTYIFLPKGKGCVVNTGATNKILPLNLLKLEHAQIALNGVSKLFGISKSKINRLKLEAIKFKLIERKKTFVEIPIPKSEKQFKFYDTENDYLLEYRNKLFQNEIDLILPHLSIIRWKKLKL